MRFEDTTLMISRRPFLSRESVVKEWARRGGDVVRIDRFWNLSDDECQRKSVVLYGNSAFCGTVSERLDLKLATPSNSALPSFPCGWKKRTLRLTDLGSALEEDGEIFVKPVQQKLFEARVYRSKEDLANQCFGISPSTPVLLSEVVEFTCEVRAFILDGHLVDYAIYKGTGNKPSIRSFLMDVAASASWLPSSLVLDIGHIAGRGWAIVELNPSWGSCLRGCKPELVAECIARATLKECA